MSNRIVIDPVTRIEGHLRIEAVVENGVVKDAFSAGTMVRGIEKILKGRDPRDAWAFTERVCGVCTTVHALASCRCVEDALGITVPKNAELVRNLMFCAQYVQDHVVHFYHLHALDWVDVVSMLKADPVATSKLAQSLSPWPKSNPGHFAAVQQRLKKFVESGQLGIFANGYWGNKAYKLPPEVNLLAVSHYLDALEWQKEIVKIHTIFGGKNPHPNYLVGGVPCSFNLEEVNAINTERLDFVGSLIKDAIEFVEQVYIPDLLAIASFYKDWGAIGGGLQNYLAYGDLPTRGYNDPSSFLLPRGAILDRNLNEIHEVNGKDLNEIKEYISHSWYQYGGGDGVGLHPFKGETEFNYTGPKPPYEHLDVEGKYSWLKTPRWKDHAMEVGPLSRMLVAYAKGNTDVKELTLAMLSIFKAGGLGSGGFNFDAKLRRPSIDAEDLFHAHIGGMDAYALAFKMARRILTDGRLGKFVAARYASFDDGFGRQIEKRKIGFKELEKIAQELGEPTPKSGKQEYLENLLNTFLHG